MRHQQIHIARSLQNEIAPARTKYNFNTTIWNFYNLHVPVSIGLWPITEEDILSAFSEFKVALALEATMMRIGLHEKSPLDNRGKAEEKEA